MVKLFMIVAGLAAASVQALPLQRRIAQSIPASTQQWEQACRAAGGGERCNPISVTAFSTLLANAGACEQQDAGDTMVDLAKELGSDEMIRLSQIFVQQPRNTPNSIAVPYCQKAPQNAELNGLFQCQFAGANQEKFIGGADLGAPGTIPFGLNAPLNPLGSCPANPDGPIADGTQLVDQVQSPGAPGNAPNAPNAPAPAPPAETNAPEPAETAAPPAQTNAPTGGGGGGNGGGFALANGQAAQRLNAKFATLNANSPCTAGENACVGAAFAQCVGGQFVPVSCAAGTICAALPLVNSPGTSITCANLADAEDRIARTGATGGLAGNGAAGGNNGDDDSTPVPATTVAPEAEQTAAPNAPAPAPTANGPAAGAGGFKAANGQAAQALNKKFEGLSAASPCQAGENACVDGGFAQCVGGNFVVTQCAGGLTCAALPLVNSPGTSITCTTEADALARIQASGATGGITG
ncbi:hypothetical protein EST38_g3720 [Candolleomyces aberdarensis]|uniref:Carbohydrate-binding module family 19 domain-containing protein n=1 Tax=Candolleomyces aberdarensis TaxID=2316362 RepID=A0A4Q2DQ28_9AGAR|nr:hypothetical protein EST38_g3720 [Candolleomyces aberdarensis]